MARILDRQPILLLLVPYVSSLILGPPALLLWAGGAALWFSLEHEFRPSAATGALVALLTCAAGIFAQPETGETRACPRLILFRGEVVDGPWPDRICPGTLQMWVVPIENGSKIERAPVLVVVIKGVPARAIKPGSRVVFPCEAVLGRQGLRLRTHTALIEAAEPSRDASLARGIYTLRREMKSCLQRSLSQEPASFCTSILLGIPRSVGRETRDLFKRTGTMHLLSISGLHVGIILIMLTRFLSLLNLGWATSTAVQIGALAGLCLITGGRVPVLRAALTGGCFIASNYLGRATRSSVFLFDAAFVILLLDPGACREISFQLSFAGYGSILLFLQRVPLESLPVPVGVRRVAQTAGISCAAWCGTAPLAAFYFGTIVPFAPLVNCVAVPLFGLLLWAGLLHLLIALPFPILAIVTGVIVEWLHSALMILLEWCAALLPAPIASPPLHCSILALWYALLAAALILPAPNRCQRRENRGVTL